MPEWGVLCQSKHRRQIFHNRCYMQTIHASNPLATYNPMTGEHCFGLQIQGTKKHHPRGRRGLGMHSTHPSADCRRRITMQRVSREMLKTRFSCREMQFYDILFIKSLEDDGVNEMAVRHQKSSGLTKHPGTQKPLD